MKKAEVTRATPSVVPYALKVDAASYKHIGQSLPIGFHYVSYQTPLFRTHTHAHSLSFSPPSLLLITLPAVSVAFAYVSPE